MQATDFADVRPVPGVPDHARATHRADPYWDALWSLGTHAAWLSRQAADARKAAGMGAVPASWDLDQESAWQVLDGDHNRAAILSMLGAVMGWRTITAEQAAAFTGYPPLAGHSNIARAAFAAGVMDMGVFVDGARAKHPDGPMTVLRLSRNRTLERDFLPGCTYAEQIVVTGGRKVTAGVQFDRHNILTAELALRAAEMCDLGAVLPETMSTVDQLVGTGLGRRPSLTEKGTFNQRAADATFVREDGLRIAVELTASASPGFTQKVHRWAQTLAQSPIEDSGLVVLFVIAPPIDRSRGREAATELRTVLPRILREYPGLPGRRPGDRIFMAEWSNWFPARHTVDESFFSLRASLAPGKPRDPWREVDLLSPFDFPFEPAKPEDMAAVIRGAASLGSSPSWLRKNPWPLWAVPTAHSGVNRPLATPPTKGRALTGSVGHRAPAQVPAALLASPFVSRSPRATRAAGAWAS